MSDNNNPQAGTVESNPQPTAATEDELFAELAGDVFGEQTQEDPKDNPPAELEDEDLELDDAEETEETTDEEPDDNATIDLPDGRQLTLAQIKELEASGLRQADYS